MPNTIETLSIQNFLDYNIIEEFELSADAAAGQAIISVLNVEEVLGNDYLCLLPGKKTSEIRQITPGGVSTSPQQITLSTNLLLQHRNHERVVKLFGSQIKVYRTANVDGTIPPDSALTVLGNPIPIDVNELFTRFTDPAGGADWWYKWTYYNPTTNAETDLSLSSAIRGGGWGTYTSVEAIRTEAGFDRVQNISDDDIAAKRAAAESEIDGKLTSAGYILPMQAQNGTPFVPELITYIDTLLSAGFVLSRSYGVTKPGSTKSGADKITEARAMLAEIKLNDTILTDSNKQQLLKESLVFGFPGDNSEDPSADVDPFDTSDDAAYPHVTMNKKF